MSASAFVIAALLAAGPATGDRSRDVAGWTVSDRAEEDGGRLVTILKQGPGWRLEHRFGLWRANGGVYVGATFEWNGCRSGEADHLFPWSEPLTAGLIAGRTRDYLGECKLSATEQRRLLSGLPQANATAQQWVADFSRNLDGGEE